MKAGSEFYNLYNHDFIRVAVGIPSVRVADPAYNADQTIALMRDALDRKAILVLFPELGLSAYTCDDLFHQRALLDGCRDGLAKILSASAAWSIVAAIGMPLEVDHLLYNCAVLINRGRVLGVVPKTYPPNYREFYELRQFNPGDHALRTEIEIAGQGKVPFGSRILFQAADIPALTIHAEICEDLWVPIPPSSHAALAGATVLLNLSASNITVGKADYRRELVASQSARCLAAYLYSAAGSGESTTDLAWDGHALICENGNLIAESERFHYGAQLICTEIDLERLAQERMRQTSFGYSIRNERAALTDFRSVTFSAQPPRSERLPLERRYERFPYVPSDPARRGERCAEVYEIQVQGLSSRLKSAGLKRVLGPGCSSEWSQPAVSRRAVRSSASLPLRSVRQTRRRSTTGGAQSSARRSAFERLCSEARNGGRCSAQSVKAENWREARR